MYCLPVKTPSTTYEDPLSLARMIRTALSHFLLMWHCISARLPAGKLVYSFVFKFLLCVLALLIASLGSMHFDSFSACLSSMDSFCLWMRPKKIWRGDSPSSLAMLRQVAIAIAMFSFAEFPSELGAAICSDEAGPAEFSEPPR